MTYQAKATRTETCFCASAVESRLSIIVPSYNHARYIVAALDSVLTIPVSDKELLIVDDNSTDGSVDLIERWKASNERHFRSVIFEPLQANRGLCRNLNSMIRRSTGATIVLMASDDQLIGTGVVELIRTIVDSDHLAIAGDPEVIDEDGTILFRSAMEASGRNFAGLESSSPSLARELVMWWRTPPPMCVFKRSAFCACCGVGMYDESLCFEDRDMTLRLLGCGGLTFRRIASYRYRTRKAPAKAPNIVYDWVHAALGRGNRIPWYNPNRMWADLAIRQLTSIHERHMHLFKGIPKAYLWLNVKIALLRERSEHSAKVRMLRWGLQVGALGLVLLHQLTCFVGGIRGPRARVGATIGQSLTM